MSLIALKSEKHGVHIVYNEADAVKHESQGWLRDMDLTMLMRGVPTKVEATPDPVPDEIVPDSAFESQDDDADLRDRYIAKFGAPPHHRMLKETIRARLEE